MIYNDLALFTVVAKHLSFSTAADQLGIPLSRVSRRIAELEDHFGVKLLERSTRRVRLTEEGLRLLNRCQAPMEALHEATGFADDIKSHTVHITAPVVAARTTVGPKLLEYAEQNPALSIHLTATNAMLDFFRDHIDFAFRVGPLDSSNLIARQLWPIEYCLCASQSFIEQHELTSPVKLDEVLQLPAIVSHQHWELSGGSRVRPKQIRHQIDDLDVIKDAVCRGMGIAMLPQEMVDGNLRRLTLADAKMLNRDMFAVYPSRRLLPARVRDLIDFMAR